MTDQWQAPSRTGDGREARQRPEDTVERRLTWWQRALRWVAWLTFLGLAVYNSQSVYFSGREWLALIAAIGISIWCMAKPLGGPKYELKEPAHLLGAVRVPNQLGVGAYRRDPHARRGRGLHGRRSTTCPPGARPSAMSSRTSAIFIEGWIVGTDRPDLRRRTREDPRLRAVSAADTRACCCCGSTSSRSSSGATNSRSTPTDRYPCAEATAGNR